MNLAAGVAAGVLALSGAALPAAAAAQSTQAPGLRAFGSALPQQGSISLVTLPDDAVAGGAPRRPRHALRLRSTLAEDAIRSIGIDASECAMLLRMHSRAVSRPDGAVLVLNPQLHVACRF